MRQCLIDIYIDTEIAPHWKNSDEYIKSIEQTIFKGEPCKIYKGHYTWAATKRFETDYYAKAWYSGHEELTVGMDENYPDLFVDIIQSLKVTET